MKKTLDLDIEGIGEFKVYAITQKEKKFNRVDKDGNEVKKMKVGESHFVWKNMNDEEIPNEEVFYDVNGNLVNKINRTNKVSNFKIVDKMEVYELLEDSQYILSGSSTSIQNFYDKVSPDKAVKFVLKKSSVGTKFQIAYIYTHSGKLVMSCGIGTWDEAFKQFAMLETSVEHNISGEVKVDASEISNEILTI